MGEDAVVAAAERVEVLEPLVVKVNQRERPVVAVAVDRADEQILGEEVDPSCPALNAKIVIAARA